MKKKIIIISILSILLVIIGVTSYCVSRNKISNIKVSEDSILANDLASVEVDKDEENTENLIVEEEQNLDESNTKSEEQIVETETSIQPQTTQVNSSSKATSKVEKQKTETKSEVVKEKVATKEETPTKVDIPSTVSEPKQETKVVEPPTRCTNNNNHSMDVGNSGKWFSSKSEAIAYYNSQVSYYSNLWETEQIDDATYYSKCPSGYEVWDCIYCSKWTINFYYR